MLISAIIVVRVTSRQAIVLTVCIDVGNTEHTLRHDAGIWVGYVEGVHPSLQASSTLGRNAPLGVEDAVIQGAGGTGHGCGEGRVELDDDVVQHLADLVPQALVEGQGRNGELSTYAECILCCPGGVDQASTFDSEARSVTKEGDGHARTA